MNNFARVFADKAFRSVMRKFCRTFSGKTGPILRERWRTSVPERSVLRDNKAKEFVQQFVRREPHATKVIDFLLADTGVSMDARMADALVGELDNIERTAMRYERNLQRCKYKIQSIVQPVAADWKNEQNDQYFKVQRKGGVMEGWSRSKAHLQLGKN